MLVPRSPSLLQDTFYQKAFLIRPQRQVWGPQEGRVLPMRSQWTFLWDKCGCWGGGLGRGFGGTQQGPAGRGENGPVWGRPSPHGIPLAKATRILRWPQLVGWHGVGPKGGLLAQHGHRGPRSQDKVGLLSSLHACPAETCRSLGERGFPHLVWQARGRSARALHEVPRLAGPQALAPPLTP